MPQEKLIDIKNVDISLGGKVIVNNISFTVHQHEVIGLVGPNGGGKTTLIKAIIGLLPVSQGTIERKAGIRFGYLPQKTILPFEFPITVDEALDIYQANTKKGEKLLKRLSLDKKGPSQLKKLSEGELQKLFLTIALASDPDIIILDEPTSNIDTQADRDLKEIIKEEQAAHKSIIIISHDIDTVARQADQIICLNQTVCCRGKPHLVMRSKEFQDMFHDSHYHHTHE